MSHSAACIGARAFAFDSLRTVIKAIFMRHRKPIASVAQGFPSLAPMTGYFYAWSRDGIFASLNYTLRRVAQATGREASRTAGVIQPAVKTTESRAHAALKPKKIKFRRCRRRVGRN